MVNMAPVGTYVEPYYTSIPSWWTPEWEIVSTQQKALEADMYGEVLPEKDHLAVVCSIHQTRNEVVDGQHVLRTPTEEQNDLISDAAAVMWT
jgi:hypothetical protein